MPKETLKQRDKGKKLKGCRVEHCFYLLDGVAVVELQHASILSI